MPRRGVAASSYFLFLRAFFRALRRHSAVLCIRWVGTIGTKYLWQPLQRRGLARISNEFGKSNLQTRLMSFGASSLTVPSPHSARSASNFLMNFCDAASDPPSMLFTYCRLTPNSRASAAADSLCALRHALSVLPRRERLSVNVAAVMEIS